MTADPIEIPLFALVVLIHCGFFYYWLQTEASERTRKRLRGFLTITWLTVGYLLVRFDMVPYTVNAMEGNLAVKLSLLVVASMFIIALSRLQIKLRDYKAIAQSAPAFIGSPFVETSASDRELNSPFQHKLQKALEECGQLDELSTSRLAALMHMSSATLSRHAKKELAISPGQIIKNHRLQVAHRRYQTGDYTSVASLASSVGYKDIDHFNKELKKYASSLQRSVSGAGLKT